jgi:DNA replication and repair protein RecF
MRLRRVTLQHFRNIAAAELTFEGRTHFLLGPNAQGKSNLLEAVGFITALRSFRTTDNKLLIATGQAEAAIACELEHERYGETRVIIRLRGNGKEVTCDGERMTRVGEYLARFPTVVFSSQDQQLVRGAPAVRRRWLDLTLSAMDPSYLYQLQQYHRALIDRNSLLKRGAAIDEVLAFEAPLSGAAAALVKARTSGVRILAGHVAQAYARIADSAAGEVATISYQPDHEAAEPETWAARFAQMRARDQVLKTTSTGPHRDDFALLVNDRAARDYGSEGQQRAIVLALRFAQMEFFRERSGVEPILLADDVLGELDPQRRARFWQMLGPERQVIATGTTPPDFGEWQVFRVSAGEFTREAKADRTGSAGASPALA